MANIDVIYVNPKVEKGVTPLGTKYTIYHLNAFTGDKGIVVVPDGVKVGTEISYLTFAHGFGGDYREFLKAPFIGCYEDLLKRGVVIGSSDNYGNDGWGAQRVMDSIHSVYKWVSKRYKIVNSYGVGGSMGGVTILNMVKNEVIPDIKAISVIVSVVDVNAMPDSYTPYILSAYRARDKDDLKNKTVGFNPTIDDLSAFRDVKVFLHQGNDDPIVVKTKHGDVLNVRLESFNNVTYVVTDRTAHGYAWGYTPDDPPFKHLRDNITPYDSSQVEDRFFKYTKNTGVFLSIL